MTNPEEQPTVGDFLARLEFKYDNDVLDFLKTGKGVVVVEDKVANIPLPKGAKGDKGDIGQLREGDVRYFNRRTEEAEAAAEASEASAGRSKASEEAAKTSENNAKRSEEAAKSSETKAKTSENNAKTSEANAKASEEAAKSSEKEAARQAGLSADEAAEALAHKEQTGKDRTHVDSQREHVDDQVDHVNSQKEHVDGQVKHVDSQREHIDTTTASFTTESAQAFARVENAATRAEDAQAEVELVVEDTAGAIREHVKDDADRAERSATKAAEHEAGAGRAAAEATKAEVDKLTAGAPEAFDTLKEISDELAKNATERAALANTIGKKADQTNVDRELRSVRGEAQAQGVSIIPFDPATGRQRWADEMEEVVDPEAPTGRYYKTEPGQRTSGFPIHRFQVDEDGEYYFSLWVKADKPDSRVYIEIGNGDTNLAVEGSPYGNGRYLLGNYKMPTEWTKLQGKVRFREGTHKASIYKGYFNHPNGEEQEAVQMFTDINLVPIPDHSHTTEDIRDYPGHAVWIGSTAYGTIPVRESDSSHLRVGNTPEQDYHAASKGYVDSQDAKKADTSYVDQELSRKADSEHKHDQSEITGATSYITPESAYKLVNVSKDGQIRVTTNPTSSHELTRKGYVDSRITEEVNKRPALFHGYGPPGVIEGAVPGDKYMDLEEMEIYVLPEESA